ncbi:hypothetical protein P389DRAFT_195878 [Cystobasidium minutum MCA 4210]|uniref:uncharacterized protein n=1 Tax=Cystobasidium minutum MCA 4210 TaxID=1397322 RepID=UPI0034CE6071|eukprot:jgi/Rhomi1/195878/gm1.4092_g
MVHSTAKRAAKKPVKDPRGARKLKQTGRKKPAPKEVLFDDDARREFLTGFSKRKQEKKEAARLRAIAREKEEAKQLRQQLRDTRKKQAQENVEAATQFYGGAPLDPKALMGDNESEPEEPQEQEYSGDEIVSHVIIEDFRPSDDEDDHNFGKSSLHESRRHHHKQQNNDNADEDALMGNEDGDGEDDGWNNWGSRPSGSGMMDEDRNTNIFGILPHSKPRKTPTRPQDEFESLVTKPEPKPLKKFTYETKAARRATTQKQKARRSEKSQIGRSNKTSKSSRKGSGK